MEEANIRIQVTIQHNFAQQKTLRKIMLNVKSDKVLNVDEIGINVNCKNAQLHLVANEKWTHFYPHSKRGSIAMNDEDSG